MNSEASAGRHARDNAPACQRSQNLVTALTAAATTCTWLLLVAAFALPWSVQPTAANEAELIELLATEDDSDLDTSPAYPDIWSDLITIETSMGIVGLKEEAIVEVYIDVDAGVSSILTIHGDTLISHEIESELLAQMAATAPSTVSEAGLFTAHRAGASARPSADSLAVRLTSGDVVHADVLQEDHFRIRAEGLRGRTDILFDQLVKAVRIDERNLRFHLSDQILSGSPADKMLNLHLLVSATRMRIPFTQIESMATVGKAKLPPPITIVPGIIPSAAGMVLLRGGRFTQGCRDDNGFADEFPAHAVSLAPFLMDATEITVGQFAEFVRDTEYVTQAENIDADTTWRTPGFEQALDAPVTVVSWYDAIAYCNWRSKKSELDPCYTFFGKDTVSLDQSANGFRLPTEAEWEFAARNGGEDRLYPWGDEPGYRSSPQGQRDYLANYNQRRSLSSDRWQWTNPVMDIPPNTLGVYGLGGNVWEWCQDQYSERAYALFEETTVHNPCLENVGSSLKPRRSMRGGSFKNELDLLRCSSRGSGLPHAFSNHVGFRCVRAAQREASL